MLLLIDYNVSVLLLIDHGVLLICHHISMLLLIDVTINRSWCTINNHHISMLLLIDQDIIINTSSYQYVTIRSKCYY